MAENVSKPAIFQFFQNIFSFLENGDYLLILLDFLFSRNLTRLHSEKLFHCMFVEIGETGAMETTEKR